MTRIWGDPDKFRTCIWALRGKQLGVHISGVWEHPGSDGANSQEYTGWDVGPLKAPKCVLPSDLGFDGESSWEYTFWEFGPLKVPNCVLTNDLAPKRSGP